MVPLPLFKLGSLLLRQVSKVGATRIKIQTQENPRLRAIAERGGQLIHQINMRMSVAALRDVAAERRAKEKAEAPTVKTEEQTKADEAAKEKQAAKDGAATEQKKPTSVWRRKFRPLPEAKAVDLFADVLGDTIILGVAMALIIYEYVRSSKKPDVNATKIAELSEKLKEDERRIEELEEVEKQQQHRVAVLEEALELLRDPKRKGKPERSISVA